MIEPPRQDVVFAYPTRPNKPILKGYNLKIEAGKTLALVGPSGEGKSTIMSLLLRYVGDEATGTGGTGMLHNSQTSRLPHVRPSHGYNFRFCVVIGSTTPHRAACRWTGRTSARSTWPRCGTTSATWGRSPCCSEVRSRGRRHY